MSVNIIDYIQSIGKHLRDQSRFSLPSQLENQVDQFCQLHLKEHSCLSSGDEFWRARINDLGQDDAWNISNMSAPPKRTASSGRINPAGISYLYLANEEKTAVSEVRPWKGAKVTLAKLEITKSLKLADFISPMGLTKDINEARSWPEEYLIDFMFSGLIKHEYFSMPAHAHDEHAYLASQYIAEKLKNIGLDGIKYKSVLHDHGENVCLFNTDNAEIKSTKVITVKSVNYEIE